MMADIYIENELFDNAAKKIAALKPCPFAGVVTPDQVKIAIGEFLGVWPLSIAGGVAINS